MRRPMGRASREGREEDMLTKLRRTLIAARISGGSAAHPEPAQMTAVLAAWHAVAANCETPVLQWPGTRRYDGMASLASS